MNKITLEERVEKAFKEEKTKEFLKDYLESIQHAIQHADDRNRSSALTFILLMIAFEFFSQAIISEVSFGPFKFSNVEIIHKLLPILVTYYFFDFTIHFHNRAILRKLFRAIVHKNYRGLTENNLEKYLITFSNAVTFIPDSSDGVLNAIQSLLAFLLIGMVYYLLPITFVIFSFMRLFTQYSISDFFVWISLFVSGIFMIQSYMVLFQNKDLA